MKNLFKVLFIFIGMGFLASCSDDDDSMPTQTIDTSVLSFDISLLRAPSCEGEPVISIAGPSEGILYYTIRPAGSEAPTGEDLVYAFGLNGGGDPSSVGGGRIVEPGNIELPITDYELNENYDLYAVIASEEGYLSEVQTVSYGSVLETNISESYNSYAYVPDLGITLDDPIVGSATVTPVPNEDNIYFVDSLWGNTFVATLTGDDAYIDQYVYPAYLRINDDYTVDVLGSGSDDDFYVLGGSGTYDACSNTFDLEIGQGLFNGDFTVNVLLSNE